MGMDVYNAEIGWKARGGVVSNDPAPRAAYWSLLQCQVDLRGWLERLETDDVPSPFDRWSMRLRE